MSENKLQPFISDDEGLQHLYLGSLKGFKNATSLAKPSRRCRVSQNGPQPVQGRSERPNKRKDEGGNDRSRDTGAEEGTGRCARCVESMQEAAAMMEKLRALPEFCFGYVAPRAKPKLIMFLDVRFHSFKHGVRRNVCHLSAGRHMRGSSHQSDSKNPRMLLDAAGRAKIATVVLCSYNAL